ncbi:MAG: hypothetical protein L0J60_09200 [Psychroflexus sp.]|nr:hypothetical protein [Psychroflexus sp.]
MYNKGLFILIFLSSWLTQAQLKDSLDLTEKSYHDNFLERLENQPLLYTKDLLKNVTQTSLSLESKKLNFKRVQTPEESIIYQFKTEGFFSLSEKLKVFGRFNFDKIEEKQMGFNSTLERTESQAVLTPNYFYAPQKGDWDNQIFDMMGGASYLINNHWSVGGVIHYKNHKAYRDIDPRPDLQLADYSAKVHLGYSFKKHQFIANAGLGSASTTASIIYVDDTQNAPVYKETFTKFSSGYGRVVFNSSYRRFLERERPQTAGLAYSYQYNRSRVSLDYNYLKSIKNSYNRDANKRVYFDEKLIAYKYRSIEHLTKLNFDYDGEKVDYFLQLNYQQQTGDNYSVIDQGQNYKQNIQVIGFNSAILQQENNKMLWQARFSASYLDSDYTDLLGFTKKEISALKLRGEFGKDIWTNSKNKINFTVSAEAYIPVQENLITTQVTSDTSFTDRVITPDHAFDSTSKLRAGAEVNYTLKLPLQKSLRFFVTYQNLSALGHEYQNYAPQLNTSSSHFTNFGLRLFY